MKLRLDTEKGLIVTGRSSIITNSSHKKSNKKKSRDELNVELNDRPATARTPQQLARYETENTNIKLRNG